MRHERYGQIGVAYAWRLRALVLVPLYCYMSDVEVEGHKVADGDFSVSPSWHGSTTKSHPQWKTYSL